jgi:hypothetical protein
MNSWVRRLTCLLLIICARALPAQSLRESVTDSALMNFVGVGVYRLLSDQLALASQGWSMPWVFTMPDTSPRWRALRQHLQLALNARDTTRADTARMMLDIRSVRLSADTLLVAQAQLMYRFRCDGTWWNQGQAYELTVPRSAGNAFFTKVVPTVATDSRPCRRR